MSAPPIPFEVSHQLRELAAPLLEACYQAVEGRIVVHEGAPDELVETARQVQTATLALQMLLHSSPLNEAGAMTALASAGGALLGQYDGDRKALYALFQTQFVAVLKEVGAAQAQGLSTQLN